MQNLEEYCNCNTENEFNPYWMNVMYKNMMRWLDKHNPVFMCVEHNPQPFKN